MTTIISHAGGLIYPTLIEGYESQRESGNIAHPVSGRANPDYTLRPASLRTGTLTLVFTGSSAVAEYGFVDGYIVALGGEGGMDPEIASLEAEQAHAEARVFTLTTAERTTVLMTYVVREGGRIARMLDPQTRRVWMVMVDFQEIIP